MTNIEDTLTYRNFHRLYAFLEKNYPKILGEFLETSPEELDAIVAKLFPSR